VIPAFVAGGICQENADDLLEETTRVNDGSLRVFFSDQRPHYKDAILKALGRGVQPERKGSRGWFPNPRLVPPDDLLYAQVVKHRRNGRVVDVSYKVIFGTEEALDASLDHSPVSSQINTSFVERQHGPMRQHNARFTRKTRCFSKEAYWLDRQMHLCGSYSHFWLPHTGLREEIVPPIPTKGNGSPKKWREVTPAMSGGGDGSRMDSKGVPHLPHSAANPQLTVRLRDIRFL